MSIIVFLPPSMQGLANGARQISTDGRTIGECLGQVILKYPALEEAIFGLDRGLNKKLSFFVNMENAYPNILGRELKAGDKLYIMDILAGG